ncbi:hypothetical protein HDG37_003232 [Paraburkholderia sp. MM5384-R2]|nr:hypothetical protein [Paraburkholderia sp. MM5384-R2]
MLIRASTAKLANPEVRQRRPRGEGQLVRGLAALPTAARSCLVAGPNGTAVKLG